MALTCVWLWFRGHRVASALIVLMLVPDGSSFVLRALFERPRPTPDLVMVIGGPQGFGYPSGTALHTIFFYGFMLYLLPRLTSSTRLLYGVGSVLVLWILFQGVWVIHHGRHWASDVLGGYLYGAVYLAVWIKLYPRALLWDRGHPWLLSAVDRIVGRILGLVGLATAGSRTSTRTSE
jgi:undecaprenyl-diphosphatase